MIMTNMYIELTNYYQYLDYSSSHPKHTGHSIVYSQSLRARRFYWIEGIELKIIFLKGGYPENIIDGEEKSKVFRKS